MSCYDETTRTSTKYRTYHSIECNVYLSINVYKYVYILVPVSPTRFRLGEFSV